MSNYFSYESCCIPVVWTFPLLTGYFAIYDDRFSILSEKCRELSADSFSDTFSRHNCCKAHTFLWTFFSLSRLMMYVGQSPSPLEHWMSYVLSVANFLMKDMTEFHEARLQIFGKSRSDGKVGYQSCPNCCFQKKKLRNWSTFLRKFIRMDQIFINPRWWWYADIVFC